MKRLIIAVALTLALGAAAYGAAASLTIQNNLVLQSGEDDDLTCDGDGVTVSFNLTTSEGVTRVTGVTVSGIASACSGKFLRLDLTDASGNALFTGSVFSITPPSVNFSGLNIPATSVFDVHVLIVGS